MLNTKAIISAIKSTIDISGEVSVKWCDDKEMQELNHLFRGMDKPTNVLSFAAQYSSPHRGEVGRGALVSEPGISCPHPNPPPKGEGIYLGDIAISIETIEREAKEQKKDPLDHLTHMVIHGILHLLGYDHENARQAKPMESLEISILAKLGIDNPYK